MEQPLMLRRGKRRSRYARRERQTAYMLWVKTLPCSARDLSPCDGDIEADHAGGGRGLSRKAPDDTCIPLCRGHHQERTNEGATGTFRGWTQSQMRAWLDDRIGETQRRYAARITYVNIPF